MRIGITGCSHSAGAYQVQKGSIEKLDQRAGWVGHLAKLYPHHEFHLFAKPGTGSTHQEMTMNYFIDRVDVLLLQLSDVRVSISQQLEDQQWTGTYNNYREQHKLNKDWWSSISNMIVTTRYPSIPNLWVYDYPRFVQLACSVEYDDFIINFKKHNPSRPHWMFFRDAQKYNNLFRNEWFLNFTIENTMLEENFNFWMKSLNSYSDNFNDFFILDWLPNYYNWTVFKDIARQDWDISVLEFYLEKTMERYKLSESQGIAVLNRMMEPYGGHLWEEAQIEVLTDFILTNNRLIELLESRI